MDIDKKKILLVGGGSGGHAVPILELYKKLKEIDNLELMVLGGGGEIEHKIYSRVSQYRYIWAGKMHRVLTWRNIIEFFKFVVGFFQSLFLILSFKPDVIFSKGGYVSLPVILVAKILKIRHYIHESDIEVGFANRFAANSAEKVFTGFPTKFYKRYSWVGKSKFTGQLVAKPIKHDFNFGFENNGKPTVLITGGSQGSKVINEAVTDGLKTLLQSYNVIHQTGTFSYDDVIKAADCLSAQERSSYFVKSFLDTEIMQTAICRADLVITRCGLNTLAEIAMAKKPVILVPYKHSASNHQVKNAVEISKLTGLPIIADDDLTATRLGRETAKVLKNDKLTKIVNEFSRIFPDDGLEVAAEFLKEEL